MKRIGAVVCCLLLGVGVARAQVSFKVGGSGGMTMGGQDNTIYASSPLGGDLETHQALYGLQVVAQFTPRFSLELAGLSMTDKDWEDRHGIFMTTGDIRFYPVLLSARYSIPCFNDAFRVYGLAGVGEYIYDKIPIAITGIQDVPGLLAIGNHPEITVDNAAFGYHAGLGLEWPVFRHVEVFAEAVFAVNDPGAHMHGVRALNAEGQHISDTFVQDISDNRDIGFVRAGVNYVF